MPVPNTIQVAPRDLHTAWPFVLQGLQDVIHKTKPEWLAEDVYAGLRSGAAMLFMSFSGPKPIGYTIAYFSDIPFSGRKELFIWVAWTIKPAARTKDDDVDSAVRHNFETLKALARQNGCARITCISPRPGFERWSGALGFHKLHSTYEILL